jgi:hypothetical protein
MSRSFRHFLMVVSSVAGLVWANNGMSQGVKKTPNGQSIVDVGTKTTVCPAREKRCTVNDFPAMGAKIKATGQPTTDWCCPSNLYCAYHNACISTPPARCSCTLQMVRGNWHDINQNGVYDDGEASSNHDGSPIPPAQSVGSSATVSCGEDMWTNLGRKMDEMCSREAHSACERDPLCRTGFYFVKYQCDGNWDNSLNRVNWRSCGWYGLVPRSNHDPLQNEQKLK